MSLLRWIELMHSRLKLDIGWGDLLWAAMGAPVSRDDTRVAEAVVEKYFAPGRVVIGLSVRTVFDALLSEVGPLSRSSVLMSGINIQNMADIVRAHDLTIEAVDLDLTTLAPEPDTLLNAQGRCGARLCVVTQLYGGVSEVWDAAELRKRGVLVVEDAAQAFSGDGYQGLSDADVTLFSFGPIKRRTALGGGVAVFRDPDLAARVRQRLETYDLLKERWFRARAVKYLILKLASIPWVYAGVIRAIAASGRDPDSVIGGAARGFGGQDLPEAIRKQPPRRLVSLMARRIAASPDPEFRRRIGRAFVDALPENAQVGGCVQTSAFWLMPVRASDPVGVIDRLRAAGFDATRGATSLRALAPDQTATAKGLIENVVYVPNPADLSEKERGRLLAVVCAALAEGGREGDHDGGADLSDAGRPTPRPTLPT